MFAQYEYVGNKGKGCFTQTGGANNVASLLSIGDNGSYLLGGGTLQVASLANGGTLSGGGSAAVLDIIGILDLTSGTWKSLGNTSLTSGTSSLVLLPSGSNLSNYGFSSVTALGLVHNAGTTLTVPAGQGFVGSFSTVDRVDCQGSILATAGLGIDFSGGLAAFRHWGRQLGRGELDGNTSSSISGGSLASAGEYVGFSGSGSFTQSGGSNTLSDTLTLGYNAGGNGSYNLSGSGYLLSGSEFVGESGHRQPHAERRQQFRKQNLSWILRQRQRQLQPQWQRILVGSE